MTEETVRNNLRNVEVSGGKQELDNSLTKFLSKYFLSGRVLSSKYIVSLPCFLKLYVNLSLRTFYVTMLNIRNIILIV